MLSYSAGHNLFITKTPAAGFEYSAAGGVWFTAYKPVAYQLITEADESAMRQLRNMHTNVCFSRAQQPVIFEYPGLYPYQNAGVEHIVDQLKKRDAHLLSDEPGVGKTPQAAVVAKCVYAKRILVICPATLRINWCRELKKWADIDAVPIVNGAQPIPKESVVISYALAERVKKEKFDFLIIDECHALKNVNAKRTKLIIGDIKKKWYGLVRGPKTLFLTGTPLPNGRPSELWPVIYRTAPDVINYLKYYPFIQRYCELDYNEYTGDYLVKGAKNTAELYARLRGSGFMTRRLKSEVLKDLPPKRYKMVVFSQNSATAAVIKREAPFSAEEIARFGTPVGSALPEIRQEMGVAKTPDCLAYIKELLDGGTHKVVVFAHHVEVVGLLEHGLRSYGVVSITGGTKQLERQANVDAFQTDDRIRVFIGNEAAEEGITLTAASDVVIVEPEYVPGKDSQRADRLHRVGQVNPVLVHILAVEDSLDLKILESAAFKAADIGRTLDNV